MNSKIFIIILLALSLSACAVKTSYQATGGSKADGVVELSYDYGVLREPVVDENQGLQIAIDRCRVWGYEGASEFGGKTQVCTTRMDGGTGGCARFTVFKRYQCF